MPFFNFKPDQQAAKKEKEKVMGMLEEIDVYQDKIETKFNDVGGLDDAKHVMSDVIDFFKNEQKYKDIGAKLPKGILISGPPGTGKTLLVRSVAGETGLPIIYVPGSKFVDVYAGMGAEKVRNLFSVAKKNAPCIVFIDEIDTVGKKPGAVSNASNDEREQTLNQLLSEMDGFETSSEILVIAATNRPDMLSPALLREGRFDKHIYINKPDLAERKAIFQLYIDKVKAADDIDTDELAYQTAGMTGAEIAGIVNEAAIKAVKNGNDTVEENDLFEALEQKSIGFKHSNIFLNDQEKGIASIHEAARVVALIGLAPNCSVQGVSILPTTDRLAGNTVKYSVKNEYIRTRADLLAEIQILLAGYCAELSYIGDVSTACTNDIKEATEKAVAFVCEYGLSDNIGPMAFGIDKITESQQSEIANIIKVCKTGMLKYIEDNKAAIVAIARELVEKESLSRSDLYEIVSHNPIVKDTNEESKTLLAELNSIAASSGSQESKKKVKEKAEKSTRTAKKKNDSAEETSDVPKPDTSKNEDSAKDKKTEPKSSSVKNDITDTMPNEPDLPDAPEMDIGDELEMDVPDDVGDIQESDYADPGDFTDPSLQLEEIEPIPAEPPKRENGGKKNGSRRKPKGAKSDVVSNLVNNILSK